MKLYNKLSLNEYHQSLTYDDISLIPTEISRMKSRKEVDTSSNFLGIKLAVPIVSSPMESVTGIDMAKELYKLGCLGIVNRFDSSLDELLKNKNGTRKIIAISIALNTPIDVVKKLSEGRKIICIDIANASFSIPSGNPGKKSILVKDSTLFTDAANVNGLAVDAFCGTINPII